MSTLITRTYLDYDTSEILGARVVDTETMTERELSNQLLIQAIQYNPYSFLNLEINPIDNKLKMKNMNPKKRKTYYMQELQGNIIINHYCIILGHTYGMIDYIADKPLQGTIHGSSSTLGELASNLEINIQDLKFYNGIIEYSEDKQKCYIYLYNGNSYKLLQSLYAKNKRNLFNSKEWESRVSDINNQGASVYYLRNKIGLGEYTLPTGIKHLEKFGGGINCIKLPDSIQSLGVGCFEDLDDLISISSSKSLSIIPKDCFKNSSVRDIKFSGSELIIDDSAFEACDKLTGCIVTNATKIGKHAFEYSAIQMISLLQAEIIKSYAFAYCSKLKKITFKTDRLKVIGKYAFRDCKSLKEIELPASIQLIDDFAFLNCKQLINVKMHPDTLYKNDSFKGCTRLNISLIK